MGKILNADNVRFFVLILVLWSTMWRFDGKIDARFEKMGKRIEARFEKIETRLDRIDARLNSFGERIARNEARLDASE